MTRRTVGTILALMGLGASLITAAPPAGAGSDGGLRLEKLRARAVSAQLGGGLVFEHQNNIVLLDMSGSQDPRPITTNGSKSQPWEYPAISDNGIIAAVRNEPYFSGGRTSYRGRIMLFNQSGGVIGDFYPSQLDASSATVCQVFGMHELALSPDGKRLAYSIMWSEGESDPSNPSTVYCQDPRQLVQVVNVSSPSQSLIPQGAGLQSSPSWIDNDVLIMDERSNFLNYFKMGSQQVQYWFGDFDNDQFNFEYESSPDAHKGTGRLAVSVQSGDDEILRLYDGGASPPSLPTPRCDLTGPVDSFWSPTWSPDGTVVAWREGDFDDDVEPGEGVYFATINSLSSCGAGSIDFWNQFIPGAENPDWGAAVVGPIVPSASSISLTVSKAKGKIKAKGKVSPNRAGQRVNVVLFRKKGGRFVKVAAAKPVLSASSSYGAMFKRPPKGSCKVTATFPGDGTHKRSQRSNTFRC